MYTFQASVKTRTEWRLSNLVHRYLCKIFLGTIDGPANLITRCGLQIAIDRVQTSREVLATPELQNITGTLNPYQTTEIHCNEFYPNSTVATLSVNHSASAYMAVLLLESFQLFLGDRRTSSSNPSSIYLDWMADLCTRVIFQTCSMATS